MGVQMVAAASLDTPETVEEKHAPQRQKEHGSVVGVDMWTDQQRIRRSPG